MKQFKLDDIVQFKHGGPNMHVYDVVNNNSVTCVWFDKNEQFHKVEFRTTDLVDGRIKPMPFPNILK